MYDYKYDRRLFARFDVDFSAQVKMSGAGVDSVAQCCNISAAGVSLVLDTRLTPSAVLDIGLKFPDAKIFNGLARVMWARQIYQGKWRIGLEFAEVNFMKLRRVLDFAKI
ncbi:MAG: PilZ domain-containing protein [Candidatus Omnitrophica bacterium]|nr:PilZ domain-containing protein [Candidatus Omnitrophota bacterium]